MVVDPEDPSTPSKGNASNITKKRKARKTSVSVTGEGALKSSNYCVGTL
jgi:hypothetical protein